MVPEFQPPGYPFNLRSIEGLFAAVLACSMVANVEHHSDSFKLLFAVHKRLQHDEHALGPSKVVTRTLREWH